MSDTGDSLTGLHPLVSAQIDHEAESIGVIVHELSAHSRAAQDRILQAAQSLVREYFIDGIFKYTPGAP